MQAGKDALAGKDAGDAQAGKDALAGKDPQAGKDAGDAKAGQRVRDALHADCTSPWRPSSTCRTSSSAGDRELKDISFAFQLS